MVLRHGLWTSRIVGELVRKASSWAHHRPAGSETQGWGRRADSVSSPGDADASKV